MPLIYTDTTSIPRQNPEIVEGLQALERRYILAKGNEPEAWSSLTTAEMDFVCEQLYKCTRGPGTRGIIHFLCNYFFIKTKQAGLIPMYPLWDSQQILLEAIDKKWRAKQAVWFMVLKARQLGITSVVEGIILALTIFNKNWSSLLLADEPSQTEYIFEMSRNGYELLPWWMRPEKRYDVKGHHMIFDRNNEVERIQNPGLKSQLIAESANQRTGAGYGKAQPLDAKVLTPSGWVAMGDIHLGDYVIAADGRPVTVCGVYPQGEKEIFKVTMSDGSSTECCDEHLWMTQTAYERSKHGDALGNNWKYARWLPKLRNTKEIRKTILGAKGRKNHQIPLVNAVQLKSRPVPIEPYLLGVLLGDGCFSTPRRVALSCAESELLERCRPLLPAGSAFAAGGGTKKIDYHIKGLSRKHDGTSNPCLTALRYLKLQGLKSHNKFIPDCYKFNTPQVRLSVIRGLMDTDGEVHISKTSAYYTTISKQLAEDMRFMVQSFGGSATIVIDDNRSYTYKGKKKKGQRAYRMCISMPTGINPFLLSRKANDLKPRIKYQPARYITSVESVGLKEAQCIQIDDLFGLYVTDDLIVTHNTFLALHASEVPKFKDARVLTEGILPTVPENNPNVFAILEGAAQRRHDDWHRMWKAAEARETKFEPIFIPWFGESQYFTPPPEGWLPRKEVEAVGQAIQTEFGTELKPGQLCWYENKLNDYLSFEGDDSTFLTQFPSNPHEAFQNAGICAFSKRKLHLMMLLYGRSKCWRGEIRLPDKNTGFNLSTVADGRLKVWQFPKQAKRHDANAKFYVAGDPSGGTSTGHPAAWQVLRLPSSPFEAVVQVACWKGHAGPSQFARIGAALGYLYDSAEVCPEANNMGQTVVSDLKNVLNYPYLYRWRREDRNKGYFTDFFGWLMTHQSKKALIQRTSEGIDEDLIVIQDPDTIDEGYDFVSEDGEEFFALSQDGHGDLFIALMIGYYCAYQNRPMKERSPEREEYLRNLMDKDHDFANTDFSPLHDKSKDAGAGQTDFLCL